MTYDREATRAFLRAKVAESLEELKREGLTDEDTTIAGGHAECTARQLIMNVNLSDGQGMRLTFDLFTVH